MATTIAQVQYTTPAAAWQVAANSDIWTVFTSLMAVGYTVTLLGTPPSNYQINLSHTDYPALVAHPGDWIVFDGEHATVWANADFTTRFKTAT